MYDERQDSASIVGQNVPMISADGDCLAGTLEELGSGAKPMSAESLAKIKKDALELLGEIVRSYVTEVAEGEVGADGSARVVGRDPKSSTGLLYGRIQSGKTVAMIALVAAAIDNGFRVVIVLTSDNVKLVSQTADRFSALAGPVAVDALKPSTWQHDETHLARQIERSGVVFVCSKNKARLDELIAFLRRIGAPDYPALILDDEADQATPDTNVAKRSRAAANGAEPVDPTAIHERVANELRSALTHHVFVQVTATPYALLLQSVGTRLRPSFTRLLEPGNGYTGGESFFEAEHLDGPKPPLVHVDDNESKLLADAGVDDAPPDGLRTAIAAFLIAAGAQAIDMPSVARQGQNFLCHTSHLRVDHRKLATLVRNYINRIDTELEAGHGETVDRLHSAFDEMQKTLPQGANLGRILTEIRKRIASRRVVVINAESDDAQSKGLNFIIGGNILGRGVTIDNLLVTYYLREPKSGQMDTTLQHARMYGYRQAIMPYTRVFLSRQLATRFHEIHRIEQRLRRQLASADMTKPIAVERTKALGPTRRSVLDPDYVDSFAASDQVYPLYPDLNLTTSEFDSLSETIRKLLGGSIFDTEEPVPIEFDDLLRLIDAFPFNSKAVSSSWSPLVLQRVLEPERRRCGGRALLFSRRMKRRSDSFATGALSGPELAKLRELDAPVFCAFRDDGTGFRDKNVKPYWYPSLVFDKKMPSVVVNVTHDDD